MSGSIVFYDMYEDRKILPISELHLSLVLKLLRNLKIEIVFLCLDMLCLGMLQISFEQ